MSDIVEGNPGPDEEREETGDTEGNVSTTTLALQMEGADLLTAEEMEAATPCDIIEVDEDAAAEAAEEAAGTRVPDGGMVVEGAEPEGEEPTDAETLATSGGYNYPPPFSRYEVFTPYTTYPYRCIGKLFFRQGRGTFVCSAASIGNNAIWTAGHCLHRGDNKASGWSTNVVFVPAYKDGAAPYGQWQAKQLFVRTAWYRSGNPGGLCQDMGAAVLHPRNNRKISQVVGSLGFAWNWSRYQHWFQMGYPAANPFNGRRLIASASSFAYNGGLRCNPKPVGVGSDLTGGSSGGPWILRFGRGNYLNGNNSYRRRGKSQEMYSPLFNNNARSLYNAVINR